MVARKSDIKSILKNLSTSELRELLDAKAKQERKRLPGLKARLRKLQKEIAKIDQEIAGIEGTSSGTVAKRAPGRRPAAKKTSSRKAPRAAKRSAPKGWGKRKMTLRQAITQVLRGSRRAMGPAEIRDAIIKKDLYGEPTKSFYQQIVICLSRCDDFVSTGRGQYKLK